MEGWRASAIILFHLIAGFQTIASAQVCGMPMVSDRIVGGEDAVDGAWPWQVSLQIGGHHICGGSLITHRWVVSAAHCYYKLGYKPSQYTVCLGMYRLSSSNPNSVCYGVNHLFVHPLYKKNGGTGDILLVELNAAVTFTSYILPVCLPEPSVKFPSGMNCSVTGWGKIFFSTSAEGALPSPKTLQQVMVPLVDQLTCDQLYHVGSWLSPSTPIILSDMICAGYKEGGKDSCQGDSGGPLVCPLDGAWFLTGIVSWGDGCAEASRPGVYTLVTEYDRWIQQYAPEVTFGVADITMNGCGTRTSLFSLIITVSILLLNVI